MKRNIKRVLLMLCMVTCLVSLSACSKADTGTQEIDATHQGYLEQIGVSLLQEFADLPKDQLGAILEQQQESGDPVLAAGLVSWIGVEEELGAYIAAGDISIDQIEDGYSVKVESEFQKRAMQFSVGVDKDLTTITSISFNPVYTTSENMTKAGMNTVMGMGTVFLVLIFISMIIGCFKYINAWEMKRQVKNQPIPVPVQALQPEEEELVDDLELVAVITAAIAAAGNTAADGLVVRSIKRSPANQWKKHN